MKKLSFVSIDQSIFSDTAFIRVALCGLTLISTCLTFGSVSDDEKKPTNSPLLGGESTFIWQWLPSFRSPYEGVNSLSPKAQGRLSDTYTMFLGHRFGKSFDVYLNPEMARGGGIGDAVGLGGFTNGDVIRNPTLGQDPYIARAFVRWTSPLGTETDAVETGPNQIAGKRTKKRIMVTAGKLGTNDIFDTNAYANSTRTQFMNWTLINNGAYDYAADTRGYTEGAIVEWVNPAWTLRFGSLLMPKEANGIELDGHVKDSRGDQVELESHPKLRKGLPDSTVRYMAYRNFASMGDYRQAIAQAPVGGVPDITATRQRGRIKYGFGLNIEQPIADDGETGLFSRLGWCDGRTESFAYTEVDDHLSFGMQISGKRWHRPGDAIGLAFVSDGLSAPHRDYLAAGGQGFLLGDGRLNYGRESILEAYYAKKLGDAWKATLDFQSVLNPGYNTDRGPVFIISARLHYEF